MLSIILFICYAVSISESSLVLTRNNSNETVEFEDAEAGFGPTISEKTPNAFIFLPFPNDGCTSLSPPPQTQQALYFAIMYRGNCTFMMKVYNAQLANYVGAVIINNDSNTVFPMGADGSFTINIPAIMVGRKSGASILKSYMHTNGYIAKMVPNPGSNVEYYLVPFLVILSLAFLTIIIFLTFRVVRSCLRQSKNRLSRDVLNKLPEITFSEDYQNLYETCAICLEDYVIGDKLRVLPCHHAYHSKCVDRWLLHRQSSCPVCKYRIRGDHSNESEDDSSQADTVQDRETHTLIPRLDSSNPERPIRSALDATNIVENLPISRKRSVSSADFPQMPSFMLQKSQRTQSTGDMTALLQNMFTYSPNTVRFHEEQAPDQSIEPLGESLQELLQEEDNEPLLNTTSMPKKRRKAKPSPSWLSGGQLPNTNSTGNTWLGFDNPAAQYKDSTLTLVSSVHSVKVDFVDPSLLNNSETESLTSSRGDNYSDTPHV